MEELLLMPVLVQKELLEIERDAVASQEEFVRLARSKLSTELYRLACIESGRSLFARAVREAHMYVCRLKDPRAKEIAQAVWDVSGQLLKGSELAMKEYLMISTIENEVGPADDTTTGFVLPDIIEPEVIYGPYFNMDPMGPPTPMSVPEEPSPRRLPSFIRGFM